MKPLIKKCSPSSSHFCLLEPDVVLSLQTEQSVDLERRYR